MSNRTVAALLAGFAFLNAAGAHAQDSFPTIEQVEAAERGKSLAPASNIGSLIDRGNQAAKDLAEREGISIGEATRQLRLSRQAANAVARQRVPNFGLRGSIKGGKATFYVSPDQNVDRDAIRAVFDQDLRGAVRFVEMPRSTGELTSAIQKLSRLLGEPEGVTGFQLSPRTGTVEILSTDRTATEAAIAEKAIDLPAFVTIIESGPIVLTESAFGGTTAGLSTSTCRDAMWGFAAYDGGDINKAGLLTVAHATRNSGVTQLRYGQSSAASGCGSGSSWQPRIRYWVGGNDESRLGIDVAFHRNTGTTAYPYFWNGTAYVKVLDAMFPVEETPVCKYGHVTGKTCGRVELQLRWSNGYGYMSAVRITDGSPKGSEVGDSGGPVWFSTNTAVGIQHAQWSLGGKPYFLYSEIQALSQHNANVTIATSN